MKEKPSMASMEKVKQNLSELSVAELRDIIAHAESLRAKKRKQENVAFLDEVRRMAADRGLEVGDILPAAARGKAAATPKAPPKYRNPDNPKQMWSGRGRAPAWAAPLKKAGKLSELAIS
jgi:DNA-binding protein H-NS